MLTYVESIVETVASGTETGTAAPGKVMSVGPHDRRQRQSQGRGESTVT